MNVAFLTCACLLVAGQAEDKKWSWFEENGYAAQDHAENGMKEQALALVEQMRKEAARQQSPEKQAFAEMYEGVCQFYLGNLSQSIKSLAAIEAKEANLAFRHEIYRDLADSYLESGQLRAAQTYLQKAVKLHGDAKVRKFPAAELMSIQLKQIQCQIGLREIKEARAGLAAIRPGIPQVAKASKQEIACLDARWQMLHAGLDLDARNVVGALVRMDKAQKSLQVHPGKEALDLRFKCHLALASDYWLLARFADAGAQLSEAGKLVDSIATQRNRASLQNAQAALLIERAALAVEDDPSAGKLLDDLDAAQTHLGKALEHHDAADKARDTFTATVDFQLAQVHDLRGRGLEFARKGPASADEFTKGKDRCDKALAWFDKALPAENDLVLEVRNRRAWLNFRLGDAKAAEKEGREALDLFDKSHKPSDLDRGRYLHVLLEAENRLGNPASAARYAERHRRQVDDGLGTILAGLSASEQIQFFRKWDTPALNAGLRLGIQHGNDQELAAASVEWLINGKARLAELLATQVKATRQADKASFASYQKSVQRQAYLLYGEPTPNAEREFLFEEANKRDVAEAAAARQGPAQPHWYTLKEVRASLGNDEIYVGLYALRPTPTAERAYQAWIVPRQGPVQTLKLGAAREIDDLVKIFLREQERVPLIAPGDEKRAEQALRDTCLKRLSALILEPIRALAGGKNRWVVSPDGPLWNIPWAALLLPDGERYAIEEMTFRYAVSGSDLVKAPTGLAKTGAPLILGDPWFNYPNTDPRRLRKLGVDPLRIPWDRLEYSEKECNAMSAIMQAFQMKPTRMQGVMQKDRLLNLPQAPRMVYLSTHAFAVLPSRFQVDDPLLSCALAFAGWNYFPETKEGLPGMMTGAEVLAIDLRGTELVVLASCETDRQAIAQGQSPANLRHAFHLAGAQAVVSALWSINDKSTMELMEPFMDTICRPHEEDKASALRAAQQQSIRYLRMYRDHAHPYYWAGFTISGS